MLCELVLSFNCSSIALKLSKIIELSLVSFSVGRLFVYTKKKKRIMKIWSTLSWLTHVGKVRKKTITFRGTQQWQMRQTKQTFLFPFITHLLAGGQTSRRSSCSSGENGPWPTIISPHACACNQGERTVWIFCWRVSRDPKQFRFLGLGPLSLQKPAPFWSNSWD